MESPAHYPPGLSPRSAYTVTPNTTSRTVLPPRPSEYGYSKVEPADLREFPELPVGDILYGHGEWRDVQLPVRSAIKTLYDTVQLQASSIRQLQRALANKADASDVAHFELQLQGKMGQDAVNQFNEEMRARLVDVNVALSQKVDQTELNAELDKVRNTERVSSPQMQKWMQFQGEKNKNIMVDTARQLSQQSAGLVSEALDVAARYREVELDEQKIWTDTEMKALRKNMQESQTRETQEREHSVLNLWKEIRAIAESVSMDQADRRLEYKQMCSATEELAQRISAMDINFSAKLTEEAEQHNTLSAKVLAMDDRLSKAVAAEGADRRAAVEQLRTATQKNDDAEADARLQLGEALRVELSGVEQKVVQVAGELGQERADRAHADEALKDALVKLLKTEEEARRSADELLGMDMKAQERKLVTTISNESAERQRQDAGIVADTAAKLAGEADARVKLQEELCSEIVKMEKKLCSDIVDCEKKLVDAVLREAEASKQALQQEADDRKQADHTLRMEYGVEIEAARSEMKTLRNDMISMEDNLADGLNRETEERRKADTAYRHEVAAELEAWRKEQGAKLWEYQTACVDSVKSQVEAERVKRESAHDMLKAQVDFHVKGTADEVIQIWTYVQRIDSEVRDVVLRLDKRMAKIYGRTWK